MKENNLVYHGSKIKGLKLIKPSVSTHGQPYVYAVRDRIFSFLFLSSWGGDLSCQVSRVDGMPTITERFKGAFSTRYKNRSGSIYSLNGESFRINTSWPEEVVSESEVEVIDEIIVHDVMTELLEFEKRGELVIYRFPDRPGYIPADDSDIIDKFREFPEWWDEGAKGFVNRFLPHLYDQIDKLS